MPRLLSVLFCLCFAHMVSAADSKTTHADLTAAQIVEKHVAARGGLQAWHAVQTLSVTGKMEAGSGDSAARSARLTRSGTGAAAKNGRANTPVDADPGTASQQVQLPFTLQMKRPRKSRLEIEFAGKTAVQVYDGTNGWKVRPYLNRNDVETFTPEEAKSEATKADIEGPLFDYAAQGATVQLEGVEPVDQHNAYRLKLTAKDGHVQHIWIDTQSFLDVKVEGTPRQMDGRMRSVWIYQRDFRSVQGLMIPYAYETVVEGGTRTHGMTIQTVAVNVTLDDSRFTKPQILVAASSVPAARPTSAVK